MSVVATNFITSKKYIRDSEQNQPTYIVHGILHTFHINKVINIGSLHISQQIL